MGQATSRSVDLSDRVSKYPKLIIEASAYNSHDGSVYRESINTVEKPLYPPTLYDDALVLQTVENVIDAYDPGNSIAALPREGLLPSQPFPWDTSKDVYAYHGYHSLHSVVCA